MEQDGVCRLAMGVFSLWDHRELQTNELHIDKFLQIRRNLQIKSDKISDGQITTLCNRL